MASDSPALASTQGLEPILRPSLSTPELINDAELSEWSIMASKTPALASTQGSGPIPLMTHYKYTNEDLNFDAELWECQSQLSYTSFGNSSPWHGSWTEDKHGRILLKFHQAGDIAKLKVASLMKLADGLYVGHDYRGRCIQLERRAQYLHIGDGLWRPL